jgi:hypothetical protein
VITSIHHYELAESADPSDFRDAVEEAVRRELFASIPGLVDYRFVRGIKGDRTGKFAAVWTYESLEAWSDVWGPVDDPVPKAEYPDEWLSWEDELLEPIPADDPDDIQFTSYEVVAGRDSD